MAISAWPARVGRYGVDAPVAAGAFAEVLAGRDEVLGVPVAIKVLHGHLSFDKECRTRFIQEARLLRRIADPHLLAVHDVGQLPDGRPYFVADLAAASLAARVDGGTTADIASLTAVVDALESALAALHAAQVVHRDVSLSNLLVFAGPSPSPDTDPGAAAPPFATGLVAVDESVVLGDLGLALDLTRTAGLTSPGGTPRYRAPEQAVPGDLVGPQADVYGATAVMWRLVCGTEPPLPSELDRAMRTAPHVWRDLFGAGLAASAEDRIATIGEWASAARSALAHGSRGLQAPPAWPADRCPYPGLAALAEADEAVFFGRDHLVDELVTRLEAAPAVLVGGASGVGKSSLLRAGLAARLRATGIAGEPVSVEVVDPAALAANGLGRADVVIVDQLEQLLVEGDDARNGAAGGVAPAAAEVLAQLEDATGSGRRVVLGLRSDFYAEAGEFPWLAELIARHVFVRELSAEDLRELIEGPAVVAGLRIEPELVAAAMSDATGARTALPHLAHALASTWERRVDRRLTLDAYRSAGGVAGAMAASGEALVADLSPTVLERLRRLLLRMVAAGRSAPSVTARPLRLASLDRSDRALLDRVVAARLVSTDGAWARLSHEAIITSWPTLRRWVDEHRGTLRMRDDVETAARRWHDDARPPDALPSRRTSLRRVRGCQTGGPHTIPTLPSGRNCLRRPNFSPPLASD